jgi:protein tyrosine phosphatase
MLSFNMDITTGHVILSYMEEHLNEKNRLAKEWDELCSYEPDTVTTSVATLPTNMTKNRYSNILPCNAPTSLINHLHLKHAVGNYLIKHLFKTTTQESSWRIPRRAST